MTVSVLGNSIGLIGTVTTLGAVESPSETVIVSGTENEMDPALDTATPPGFTCGDVIGGTVVRASSTGFGCVSLSAESMTSRASGLSEAACNAPTIAETRAPSFAIQSMSAGS